MNRGPNNVNAFFARHRREDREFSHDERVRVLQLLEMQRYAMLMFTSCGWFFDELSGIETVKVIEYAGRVIQLSHVLFPSEAEELESGFMERLSHAKSNLAEHTDGAALYVKWVKPAIANLQDVAAHYAISSMFEVEGKEVPIYCYRVEREEFHRIGGENLRAVLGRARVTSKVTEATALEEFAVTQLGDHDLRAGVHAALQNGAFQDLARDLTSSIASENRAGVAERLDAYFGESTYTLKSLFADERQRILDLLLQKTLRNAEDEYRKIYEQHGPMLSLIASTGATPPKILSLTGEFVTNAGLRRELGNDELDHDAILDLWGRARAEKLELDSAGLAFTLQNTLERQMDQLCRGMEDLPQLQKVAQSVMLAKNLDLPVNLWRVQNVYFKIAHEYVFGDKKLPRGWPDEFIRLGEQLSIRTYRTDRLGQPQEAA
jgi:hypothetical protein